MQIIQLAWDPAECKYGKVEQNKATGCRLCCRYTRVLISTGQTKPAISSGCPPESVPPELPPRCSIRPSLLTKLKSASPAPTLLIPYFLYNIWDSETICFIYFLISCLCSPNISFFVCGETVLYLLDAQEEKTVPSTWEGSINPFISEANRRIGGLSLLRNEEKPKVAALMAVPSGMCWYFRWYFRVRRHFTCIRFLGQGPLSPCI